MHLIISIIIITCILPDYLPFKARDTHDNDHNSMNSFSLEISNEDEAFTFVF